jgi:hypothetical protein
MKTALTWLLDFIAAVCLSFCLTFMIFDGLRGLGLPSPHLTWEEAHFLVPTTLVTAFIVFLSALRLSRE